MSLDTSNDPSDEAAAPPHFELTIFCPKYSISTEGAFPNFGGFSHVFKREAAVVDQIALGGAGCVQQELEDKLERLWQSLAELQGVSAANRDRWHFDAHYEPEQHRWPALRDRYRDCIMLAHYRYLDVHFLAGLRKVRASSPFAKAAEGNTVAGLRTGNFHY